jgi:hypothetical protein
VTTYGRGPVVFNGPSTIYLKSSYESVSWTLDSVYKLFPVSWRNNKIVAAARLAIANKNGFKLISTDLHAVSVASAVAAFPPINYKVCAHLLFRFSPVMLSILICQVHDET